jgi:hypothetical protein
MAVGRLVRAAAAASLAVMIVGCSHRTPDACTVACGAESLCPEGNTCGRDGYCHAADDDSLCLPGEDLPDAAPPADGSRFGDAGDCDGEPDEIADADARDVNIPDGDPVGVDRTIAIDAGCVTIESIEVRVEIVHPYRGDIELELTAPSGGSELLLMSSDDSAPDIFATFDASLATGESAEGEWVLNVSDVGPQDLGTLQYWSLGINMPAP